MSYSPKPDQAKNENDSQLINTHLPLRDVMLGILVMLVWAGNGVVIKAITMELPPFTGLAIRFAIAMLFFAPFIRWPGKEQFKIVLQVSLLMSVCHWGSLIWAIDKLDASMAAILMQMQVIFSVLIGRFFFNEKFDDYFEKRNL